MPKHQCGTECVTGFKPKEATRVIVLHSEAHLTHVQARELIWRLIGSGEVRVAYTGTIVLGSETGNL